MGGIETAAAIVVGVPVAALAVYILARVAGLGWMRSIRDAQQRKKE